MALSGLKQVNDPHLSLWSKEGTCEETLTTQALH